MRVPRAFTLLEVLLAMVIFALVSVSVLMTMRTATRSYERSGKMMEGLQTMRAVSDTLSRDLRSVFLIDETNYGIALPADETVAEETATSGLDEATRERVRQRLAEQGIVDYSLEQMDSLVTDQDLDDPGLTEDLSFVVNDGGETDSVSFARRLRSMTSRRAQPWGLSRLTFSVEGERLVRSSAPVFGVTQTVVPEPGESYDEAEARQAAENPPPEPTREDLAEGVTAFDVHCLFWADGGWKIADAWNSEDKVFRNPYAASPIQPGDANYPALLTAQENEPKDGLPAALEVLIGLREPSSGQVRTSRLLIPLVSAQETWAPADQNLLTGGRSQSRSRGRR
jgi:prepilin-type N-terminal cleavage/methylation domain-containing protein